MGNIPAHLPHIKAGKLRVLAVTSRDRSPLLPEVPTMAEAGVPGFESATNYTLFAPAATPKETVSLINRELNLVLQMPEVRDRLLSLGIVVSGGSSQAAQARIAPEMNRWAQVIKAGNIKTD